MKSILYGTTALMAVGLMAGTAVAAEKIKLGLGGYWRASIAVGDSDNDAPSGSALATDNRDHGFAQESEIYFSGKTTLDNGIKFGVSVQLEGETSGDQIDNTYIWSSGSFGRVEFGETWGPSLLMSYGSVGDFIDGYGDFASTNAHGTGNPNGQFIDTYGGDAGVLATPDQKMNYFTPRMAGFQLGLSYMPENKIPPGGATTNVDGSALDSKLSGSIGNEMIDVGVNYTGKFSGASVAAFGSFFDSESEPSAIGAVAGKDVDGYSAGGQVGFSGFRVGGRYTKINDIAGAGAAPLAAAGPSADRTSWRVGADYGTGPWSVGVTYYHMEQEIIVAGVKSTRDDEIDLAVISARYILGPGVSMFAGVQFYDFQDSANIAGASPATEGDHTIGIIGTALRF